MMSPVLLRVVVYLLIFGGVAVALAPRFGWVAAVLLAETVAFAVIRYWGAWQRRRLVRELREAIAREEALRDGRA
jgi:membrane protein implicated in regulation of membrane protease activity